MAAHTTNLPSTFIAVADDCPTSVAVPPPTRDSPTIGQLHFELIHDAPYAHTSDDVIWTTHALRNDIDPGDTDARDAFFSRGQACLRTSPLTRRYGWGVHADERGRVALVARDDPRYDQLTKDAQLEHTQAMRSSRAK